MRLGRLGRGRGRAVGGRLGRVGGGRGHDREGGGRGTRRESPTCLKEKLNKEIVLSTFASDRGSMGAIRSIAKLYYVNSAGLLEGV